MKKLSLLALAVLCLFGCTKSFHVAEVDSVNIKDGSDNVVPINLALTFSSVDSVLCTKMDNFIKNEEELTDFVQGTFNVLKYKCNYPRTFKPSYLSLIEFQDTLLIDSAEVYEYSCYAHGYAKNAYGVEGSVSELLHLLCYKEKCVDGSIVSVWAKSKHNLYFIRRLITGEQLEEEDDDKLDFNEDFDINTVF